MQLKQFIQLFVPPIYYKVKKLIFPKKKQDLHSLPMRERKGSEMIIIGNGPSLNESFDKYKDIICSTECIAVNFFASTSMYTLVRPSVYVLNDFAFFNIPEHLKSSIDKLLTAIVDETDWDMDVVLPYTAKQTTLIDVFAKNPHLRILYFNVDKKCTDDISLYEALDKNLMTPPDATVLTVCVWMSIYWGYPETYIIGADSSWISELMVDQQTNQLYTIDKHFYNNSDIYKEKDLFDIKNRRILSNSISTELRCITASFKAYEQLEEYAKWKGLKVFNASEYSLIDAFERKKLN